jgi:hypothetical protein
MWPCSRRSDRHDRIVHFWGWPARRVRSTPCVAARYFAGPREHQPVPPAAIDPAKRHTPPVEMIWLRMRDGWRLLKAAVVPETDALPVNVPLTLTVCVEPFTPVVKSPPFAAPVGLLNDPEVAPARLPETLALPVEFTVVVFVWPPPVAPCVTPSGVIVVPVRREAALRAPP